MAKSLIIYHWDSDGICSAALLFDHLSQSNNDISLFTPRIGQYWIGAEDIKQIHAEKNDRIFVVDLSLPTNNLNHLQKDYSKLQIFDHHAPKRRLDKVDYINPYLNGRQNEYPSTTWIIKDFLSREIDLPAILGVVGDQEKNLMDSEVSKEISGYLQSQHLTLGDAIQMTHLIDSNYKTNDREGVIKAVEKVLQYNSDPPRLLKDPVWTQRARLVDDETEKWSAPPYTENNLTILKEIQTPLNITSAVTRKIAWKNPGKITIVTNKTGFDDNVQLYLRGFKSSIDLSWIIERALRKGYSSGGRPDVVGVILPSKELDNFLNMILRELERNNL